MKAREWYEKAAELGENTALYRLGEMYEEGRGCPQDYAKAREWYEKAAEIEEGKSLGRFGGVAGLYRLGEMYEEGRGCPQDKEMAKEYFKRACAAGYEAGCEACRRLEEAGS